MLLKDWMRGEGISDADMAERIGGITSHGVRKLRFRERGPSIRVAARIEEISGGKVRSPDLQPVKRRPPSAPLNEIKGDVKTSPCGVAGAVTPATDRARGVVSTIPTRPSRDRAATAPADEFVGDVETSPIKDVSTFLIEPPDRIALSAPCETKGVVGTTPIRSPECRAEPPPTEVCP